jgi:hypothetical protein
LQERLGGKALENASVAPQLSLSAERPGHSEAVVGTPRRAVEDGGRGDLGQKHLLDRNDPEKTGKPFFVLYNPAARLLSRRRVA